jgi:hypothetical protein
VRQTTTVQETVPDDRAGKAGSPVTGTTTTKLGLTRKWEVKAVDAQGLATLEMSITELRQEIIRPGPADKDGKPTTDTIVLDSTTAEGRKQMAEYLNKPIVMAKIDARGQLLEAKSANGASSRLEVELPFRFTLPEAAPSTRQPWERPFTITLDPPLGTGEKYAATQTYTYKGLNQGFAVIGIATALKAPPADPAEWPSLAPLMWEGEAYFQPETGRYAGAKLKVQRAVPNYQGVGTKFVYASEYTEQLLGK